MGLFCILIMVVITQIHMCIKIHRTVYQKNTFYCASVIHLLPLCSKFILHCLFSDNGSWPVKYFSFASWQSFELCEQRALKRHTGRGGFAFLVLLCLFSRLLLHGQLLPPPAPGYCCRGSFSRVQLLQCTQLPQTPFLQLGWFLHNPAFVVHDSQNIQRPPASPGKHPGQFCSGLIHLPENTFPQHPTEHTSSKF